jgi:hypothetical protein
MSGFHLTGNEVGLIVGLGGIGASMLTTYLGLRKQQDVSERTIKAQLKIANDERLWARRDALYTPLITTVHAFCSQLEVEVALSKEFLDRVKDHTRVVKAAAGGINAYASAETGDVWERYILRLDVLAAATNSARADFEREQKDVQPGRPARYLMSNAQFRAFLNGKNRDVTDTGSDLVGQLRGELQGDEADYDSQ